MPTIFEESDMRFEFDDSYTLRSSDTLVDVKKVKDQVSETKDTDFFGYKTTAEETVLFFMELKNFRGYQSEKIEELVKEVAQKLRDMIPIIMGGLRNSTNEQEFWAELAAYVADLDTPIHLVFWLEEDRPANSKRPIKPRLATICEVLQKKCKWLGAKVFVVDKSSSDLSGIKADFLPIPPQV